MEGEIVNLNKFKEDKLKTEAISKEAELREFEHLVEGLLKHSEHGQMIESLDWEHRLGIFLKLHKLSVKFSKDLDQKLGKAVLVDMQSHVESFLKNDTPQIQGGVTVTYVDERKGNLTFEE